MPTQLRCSGLTTGLPVCGVAGDCLLPSSPDLAMLHAPFSSPFRALGSLNLAWEPSGEGKVIWLRVHGLPHSWHMPDAPGEASKHWPAACLLSAVFLPDHACSQQGAKERNPENVHSDVTVAMHFPSTEQVMGPAPRPLREQFLPGPRPISSCKQLL